MIHFEYFNESFLKIRVEDYGVEQELYEFFSFFAPGYKFMPSYRKGIFDGKIRLFNLRNKQLPRGLLNIAIKFCDGRDYEFSKDPQLDSKTGITLDEVKDFVRGLNLHTRGKPLEYRDYQLEAIWKCLSDKRGILVAPTSCLDPETQIEVELDEESLKYIEELRTQSVANPIRHF